MGWDAHFSLSGDGKLAFLLPSRSLTSNLVWFDASGRRLGTCGSSPLYRNVAISPDGRKILADIQSLGKSEVRLIDAASGSESRLAFEQAYASDVVWHPRGDRIAFANWGAQTTQILEMAISGLGSPRLLAEGEGTLWPRHWSPDGRTLLVDRAFHPLTGPDILQVGLTEPAVIRPWRAAKDASCTPRFSPDGRWVAFTSDESGRDEIYVIAFPAAGTARQISTAGGASPRWRHDGRELYFLAGAGQVMKVSVDQAPGGLDFSQPAPVFRTRVNGVFGPGYDVAPDGRFLVSTVNDEGSTVVLVQNWLGEMKQ
jgi:serine/threonine-protein kinase